MPTSSAGPDRASDLGSVVLHHRRSGTGHTASRGQSRQRGNQALPVNLTTPFLMGSIFVARGLLSMGPPWGHGTHADEGRSGRGGSSPQPRNDPVSVVWGDRGRRATAT